MTPLTILKFLVGNRSAILEIAACERAPWLGLMFVFSAALAREYDGQDLLHEPWHLLLPLVASLATSFLLYLLLRTVGWFRGASWRPYFVGYRSFLGLYWMTAPLAWLYAIPLERFLDEASATSANLWILAIVALWRVVLMTRVAAVLWSAPFFATFFPVMLLADTVALLLIRLTPLPEPLFATMAGMRYASPSADAIVGTAALVSIVGGCTWLLWLIGTLWVVTRPVPTWQWNSRSANGANRVAASAWIIGIVSLLFWVPVLYLTQPEQMLRRRVDDLLRGNEIDEALSLMSAHAERDFPPFWEPPPRITYGEHHPDILEIAARLADAAPWVRSLFLAKLKLHLEREDDRFGVWRSLEPAELERHLTMLEKLPERQHLLSSNYRGLVELLVDEKSSPAFRERVLIVLGDKAEEARRELKERQRISLERSELVQPPDR